MSMLIHSGIWTHVNRDWYMYTRVSTCLWIWSINVIHAWLISSMQYGQQPEPCQAPHQITTLGMPEFPSAMGIAVWHQLSHDKNFYKLKHKCRCVHVEERIIFIWDLFFLKMIMHPAAQRCWPHHMKWTWGHIDFYTIWYVFCVQTSSIWDPVLHWIIDAFSCGNHLCHIFWTLVSIWMWSLSLEYLSFASKGECPIFIKELEIHKIM